MKPRHQKITAAFSLTELLIIIVVVCVLTAVFLPGPSRSRRFDAHRLRCVNNQKQIGTAFRLFAIDNGDRYPLQATNNAYIYPAGVAPTVPDSVVSSNAQPWQVYQSMWDYLKDPKRLLCPSDRARSASSRAINFNGLASAPGDITGFSLGHPDNQNQATSYTTLRNAVESCPLQILITDRNINSATPSTAAKTNPLPSGTRFTVASAAAANSMFWVRGSGGSLHGLEGNLSYADGSVQQATAKILQAALGNAGTAYDWGTPTHSAPGAAEFLLP